MYRESINTYVTVMPTMAPSQLEAKGVQIDRATIPGAGLVHLSARMYGCWHSIMYLDDVGNHRIGERNIGT
jgi:hypothetical protein